MANDLLVGAAVVNSSVEDHFSGLFDEVRIWSVARTGLQISAARFDSLTGAEPNLVAYWPFDEGSGDGTADLAGTSSGVLGSTAGADDGDPAWSADTPF